MSGDSPDPEPEPSNATRDWLARRDLDSKTTFSPASQTVLLEAISTKITEGDLACNHTPYRDPDGGADWYSCQCGWSGHADEVQISEKHLLSLEGVLRSHVRKRPGLYRCKVCDNKSDLKGFGDCLDSYRRGRDWVASVKDGGYRAYVYKI